MPELSILSAMITPVVLILATGQLILTTSQRLARSVERARKLSDQFEELAKKEQETTTVTEKKKFLFQLLLRAASRSKKLQQAMSLLYVALSLFVATSVAIGLLQALELEAFWIPVVLGFAGATLLLYATILLILETRIALGAVDTEMDYLTKHYGNKAHSDL